MKREDVRTLIIFAIIVLLIIIYFTACAGPTNAPDPAFY